MNYRNPLHWSFLTLVLFFNLTTFSCAQKSESTGERFIRFMNEYQQDSLANLLAEDFQLKRTYTKYQNDRSSFFSVYLPYSKSVKGTFEILEADAGKEVQHFLVRDHSRYLELLGVDAPTWKITVHCEGNKLHEVTFDTTETSHHYFESLKIADEAFQSWLNEKYPNDTQEQYFREEGLLISRLNAYVKEKR